MKFTPIVDIHKYSGSIPTDHDLVVYENGTDPASGVLLYGFDEIERYRDFGIRNPRYGFICIEMENFLTPFLKSCLKHDFS